MAGQTFVGRERELGNFQSLLDCAIAGEGRIVFVAGEPGSGKTALVREFSRRAQANNPDLVVAAGECDAQTGIGDPYLPFREILGLLTGDVDTKLAQGAITQENAKRLRALLQFSGQALVDLGPSLINLLVPGSLIIVLAGKFLATKAGWLKPLQQLNERKPAASSDANLDQTRIFEQYTNVLKALAAKKPLLLVLDDLQWADAASISLLFHLGRRVAASRILIVGAYRPDEVALGRGDERHPLDKVLAEFKRYFGDSVLDLEDTQEREYRHFVNGYLDAEPNCLGEEFREALLHHTEGQALFTVELLRSMQERGDLHKDEQGRWMSSSTLSWGTLPARVEGVIEERIGRLEEGLREILRVASVEGEDFTAQVIARVQTSPERRVLHNLSEELHKRHRLVQERGELRVNREVLARYQFAHALFQRYLYDELGVGERRLLHREVARALRELYAGCEDEITVQLARHYAEGGEDEKAIEFLLAAGNRARKLHANQEALNHYQHALGLLEARPSLSRPEIAAQLYEGLGDVSALTGQHEKAQGAYRTARAHTSKEELLSQSRLWRKDGNVWAARRDPAQALRAFESANAALGNKPAEPVASWRYEWLEIQLDRMWAYYLGNDVPEMVHLADIIRATAEQFGSPAQRCRFFGSLVRMAFRQDRYVLSEETLAYAQASLAASQESGMDGEITFSTFVLGFCHLWRGEFDQAEMCLQSALELAQRAGDLERQVLSLTYLTVVHRKRGQVEQVRCYAARSLEASTAGDMPLYIGIAKGNQAWLEWREGNLGAAREDGQFALGLWRQVPVPFPFMWVGLFPLLGVATTRGRLLEAIEHARALLAPEQARMPEPLEILLQNAVKSWDAAQPESTRTVLHRAIELAREMAYV